MRGGSEKAVGKPAAEGFGGGMAENRLENMTGNDAVAGGGTAIAGVEAADAAAGLEGTDAAATEAATGWQALPVGLAAG